jgi:hypothetical protein
MDPSKGMGAEEAEEMMALLQAYENSGRSLEDVPPDLAVDAGNLLPSQ